MDGMQRPPRPSEHALTQPDSPGRWWFSGIIEIDPPATAENSESLNIKLQEPQPFEVVQRSDYLVIVSDGWEYLVGLGWVGWWVKQEGD